MDPLAGWFLTGKYGRDDTNNKGRLSGSNPFGDTKFTNINWAVLDAVKAVAKEQDCSPAQIALAWVMAQKTVSSTIIGARIVDQLNGNLQVADIVLTGPQLAQFNSASNAPQGFTANLTSPAIRAMVFGGHDVRDGVSEKVRTTTPSCTR